MARKHANPAAKKRRALLRAKMADQARAARRGGGRLRRVIAIDHGCRPSAFLALAAHILGRDF